MYMIAYTLRLTVTTQDPTFVEKWETAETLEQAKEKYAALIRKPYVFTASVGEVIEITDRLSLKSLFSEEMWE